MLRKNDRIVLLGGAGLVGQNLLVLLKREGYSNLVVVDKHKTNIATLRSLHPDVHALEEDLAAGGAWEALLADARVVLMLQAQIGGIVEAEFERNNVLSTRRVLDVCNRDITPYIVHISSSVVNSQARDWYTESKKKQERLVRESGLPHCILRPTLMFGWFDRKHLGWLSRLMRKTPVFPIPGSGRYMRQPLYVLDFCRIIMACMQQQPAGEAYNITGREKIDYIDIIRTLRRVLRARTMLLRIPYSVFWLMLSAYALFDSDPPFTTKQLKALVTPDEFELIPWWEIFGVTPTPFEEALRETLLAGPYADIVLDF
jgi:nucleoside-diphosphate-sugar epimerase